MPQKNTPSYSKDPKQEYVVVHGVEILQLHVAWTKSVCLTLIQLHFCLQCRQKVQTLETSDSVTHTNTLECEMSLQYCYIHPPPFTSDSWELCSSNAAGAQRGSLSCPSSRSPLCALMRRLLAVSLSASHTSACCPESLALISI